MADTRRRLSVTEARRRFSELLKHVQSEPDAVYEITVNDVVVGEIRGPEQGRFRVGTGADLLRALQQMGEPEVAVPADSGTAREHDRYLYSR